MRLLLLSAIALLLLLPLLGRWLVRADTAQVARVLRGAAWGAGALLVVVLILSGRAGLAALLMSMLLPVVVRAYQRRHQRRPAGGAPPRGGRSSTVQTRYLRMYLDHDTGAMSGEVLAGRFRGRHVEELAPDDLLQLLAECQADPQSVAVLEAYLDRGYGPEWRDRTSHGTAGTADEPAPGRMTREAAYEILGLQPDATAEEIRAAHRRLMQKFHPDRGGSTYLAAMINQAKDVLLGE